MKFKRLAKLLACIGMVASLAGCSYTGRANLKVSPNGVIDLETLWLVEKPEGVQKMDWSNSEEGNPYSLLKPINPNNRLQLVEEIERDVNGELMVGWHVKARMSSNGYQNYYNSLIPTVGGEKQVEVVDPLTGEVTVKTEVIEGEDIDLNDGKIHTVSLANFAPQIQVKSSGLKKSYFISYVGILDSIPEEYREYVNDGFEFSIAPCGEVLQHNATEVSETGIYTWRNGDINNIQIIFEYVDLYPILKVIMIATITAGAYSLVYLLIRYWTRNSQLYGYDNS